MFQFQELINIKYTASAQVWVYAYNQLNYSVLITMSHNLLHSKDHIISLDLWFPTVQASIYSTSARAHAKCAFQDTHPRAQLAKHNALTCWVNTRRTQVLKRTRWPSGGDIRAREMHVKTALLLLAAVAALAVDASGT